MSTGEDIQLAHYIEKVELYIFLLKQLVLSTASDSVWHKNIFHTFFVLWPYGKITIKNLGIKT